MKRYDVESELNPRYAETGNMADYCGVYHIVEIDEDGTTRRIETMTNEHGSAFARQQAYYRVGQLMARAHAASAGEEAT